MRLNSPESRPRRIGQLIGCLLIAALCCVLFPIRSPALGETTNASLWACVTLAAMALVFFKHRTRGWDKRYHFAQFRPALPVGKGQRCDGAPWCN
jgi:hypothetical protein